MPEEEKPQKNTDIIEKITELDAFQHYLELGVGRSLAKVYEKLRENFGNASVSLRTIEEWSSKNNWVEKAEEYDKTKHEEIMKLALKKSVRSKVDILTICQSILGQFAREIVGEQVILRKTDRHGTITEEIKMNRYHPNMADVERAYRIIKEEIGEGLPDWQGAKEINLTQVFQQIINSKKPENEQQPNMGGGN